MNVIITSFNHPFSFFCLEEEDGKEIDLGENFMQAAHLQHKMEMSDVNHGQYVAVMWKKKWARGLVTLETQFLIWLIDYGIYLRPNDETIYINLASEQKKYHTKVFEASIHGVAPVDKTLTDECEIKNIITDKWNSGANEKAQSLITRALRIFFVPIALMSTKNNEVVLGDLYLEYKDKRFVNIIDELELWPVFLQKNKGAYVENLSTHYTSQRKHRACLLKPAIAEYLPIITLETTFTEYSAICADMMQFMNASKCSSISGDGSTTSVYSAKTSNKNINTLTPTEIEKYRHMYVTICGRKFNVLNVLINKTKDLNVCEKYKDYDLKGVGRACYRSTPKRFFSDISDETFSS